MCFERIEKMNIRLWVPSVSATFGLDRRDTTTSLMSRWIGKGGCLLLLVIALGLWLQLERRTLLWGEYGWVVCLSLYISQQYMYILDGKPLEYLVRISRRANLYVVIFELNNVILGCRVSTIDFGSHAWSSSFYGGLYFGEWRPYNIMDPMT